MFDEEMQTCEEEILEQGLTDVLVKIKNMADIIRLQAEKAEEAKNS